MKTVAQKIQELKEKEAQVKGMGGAKAVEKQHLSGKLTARERLELFFDAGTFQETDLLVTHRCVNFGMEKIDIPADGVVTGFGRVNGRAVFAFSQDFTSRAGSLGEMHSKKICKVMDLALKAGVPFVGFNDSGGARIQEGVDSLSGYGQIFYRNAIASGVIPQISAIMGPTAGGAVYSPAMTDFIFMVKNTSYMFITGPDVIKSVTGEEISFEDLGGALAHNMKSGVAHFACESDADAIEQIKRLLSFLPNNNLEDPPLSPGADPASREEPALDSIVPDSPRASYDMHEVIAAIVDDGDFFEPHHYYAQNMVVGFARMNGRPVGIIANQPQVLAGCLDVDAADKATRFIRFCDAFNIPLLDHRRRARVSAGVRAGVAGHHPPRGQALVVLLRGHGAQDHPDHPQGLRRLLSGHVLPGPGGGPGAGLARGGDRGHGGGRGGQRDFPQGDQGSRGPGGQAGRDHRQLPEPALQSLHRRLPGLRGPGDRAPGDPAPADCGLRGPEQQAGDAPGQEARQYPGVVSSRFKVQSWKESAITTFFTGY